MLKAGLTGNIGSGKSIVAGIFKTLGVPVFDADYEAKSILQNTLIKEQIKILFGLSFFDKGEIDRSKLAAIVFNDKTALEKLNSIIHPAVRKSFDDWTFKNSGKSYLVYEAAIIFESGFYHNLDFVITISADDEIRLNRVMKRDNATREMVMSRMKNQWSEKRKCKMADFIITNENRELLIPQVIKVHEKLLKLSRKA
jgi:dephospho-CoA kinase